MRLLKKTTMQNFITIVVPKGRKANVKMLGKLYGGTILFDYTNKAVSVTCKVLLLWGIN